MQQAAILKQHSLQHDTLFTLQNNVPNQLSPPTNTNDKSYHKMSIPKN